MIGLRMKAKIPASLIVLFCLATSHAQKQPSTNDADTAGIKQTVSDWADAFNRHDPHGCAQGFTEDADMVSLAGASFHGRKAIEDHYGHTFSTSLKNAHRTDSFKSIRFLSPEIAAVDVDWEITGSLSKVPGDNSEIPVRKGILPLIFVKQNGQWLVAVSHEIEFPVTPKKG